MLTRENYLLKDLMIFQKKLLRLMKLISKTPNLLMEIKFLLKKLINENISDAVKIGGAVYLSGSFQLANNKSINDLINSAKGLTNELLGDNAILYRSNKGL